MVSGDGFRRRPIVAADFRTPKRELNRGFVFHTIWSPQTVSNRRPHAPKARALPTELCGEGVLVGTAGFEPTRGVGDYIVVSTT